MNKKQQKKFNLFIMKGFEEFNNSQKPVSCLNCTEAHCCKNKKAIDLSEDEYHILKKILTPGQIEKGKAQLNTKAISGHYSCPFLDDKGKCSIYAVRPLACSSYAVVTPPDMCEDPWGDSAIINPTFLLNKLPYEEIERRATKKKYDILDLFISERKK